MAAVGVLHLVALSLAPVTVIWVVVRIPRVVAWAMRLGRRLGVIPQRQEERPLGPPLERIAADIRRIGSSIEALPPQASLVRRQGAILAYDDALSAACRALGVEDTLTSVPIGPARDAERLRIECELQHAGLAFQPPGAPRAA